MTSIHRPYARMKGQEPSVTTVLGILGKDGLRWAAAAETAKFAVLRPEKWRPLLDSDGPRCLPCHQGAHDRCTDKRTCSCGDCAAIDRLRKHHDGLWRGRAAMGTLVHAANESYCAGEPFDIEAAIDDLVANEAAASIWKTMNRDDIVEQALGYVLGLEKWWDTWQPEVYASESVVRVRGKYIGQADMGMRARLLGRDVLIDVKTTAQQSEDKGLYVDSWTLQTSAYAYADEEVFYEQVPDRKLKSGWRVVESGTGPWPTPDLCAVVHLRGDEEFSFFELPVDRKVHDVFLSLCDIYQWLKALPDVPRKIEREDRVA